MRKSNPIISIKTTNKRKGLLKQNRESKENVERSDYRSGKQK